MSNWQKQNSEQNNNYSTHQPQVAGKPVTVNSPAGNPVQVRGDFGVWDTVANKYVNVDQTQFGTTLAPKNQ